MARASAKGGVPIEAEIAWPQGGHSLYVRDPASNSVELATPSIWPQLTDAPTHVAVMREASIVRYRDDLEYGGNEKQATAARLTEPCHFR